MIRAQLIKYIIFIRIFKFTSLTSRRIMSQITFISIYNLHEVIRRLQVLFKISRLNNQLLFKLLIKEIDCLNLLLFFIFYKSFSILLFELILRVFFRYIFKVYTFL